jgi:hypothetical protein
MFARTPAHAARKPRIFLGLVEICGIMGTLQTEFTRQGYACTFANIDNCTRGYHNPNSDTGLIRLLRRVQRRITVLHPLYTTGAPPQRTAGKLERVFFKIFYQVLKGILLVASLPRHDVFVFINMTRFLPGYLELPLLKLLGKRVIHIGVGSDMRPPYLDGLLATAPLDEVLRQTYTQYRALRFVDTYSDAVVAHTSCAFFTRKPFVKWMYMGLPVNAEHIRAQADGISRPAEDTTLRLVHTPTAPAIKGSARFAEAVAALRAKGYAITYTQVTGRPHAEVLQTLAASDLLLDQLNTDTPMATSVAEAAVLGIPALVGSRYDVAADGLSAEQTPPVALCTDDTLEQQLEYWLKNTAARQKLGQSAQAFILGAWSAQAVAKRYLALIEGTLPLEAYCDPAEDISTTYGHGMPKQVLQERLRAYVSAYGDSALYVDDKPALKRRLLEMMEDKS